MQYGSYLATVHYTELREPRSVPTCTATLRLLIYSDAESSRYSLFTATFPILFLNSYSWSDSRLLPCCLTYRRGFQTLRVPFLMT
jgi:hypothetical protein